MTAIRILISSDARRAQVGDTAMRVPIGWEAIFRPARIEKTYQQLRTVHMWFNDIAAHLSEAPAVVKGQLKELYGLFLGSFTVHRKVGDLVLPIEINVQKSLADYTKTEMGDFMWHVQVYASENGIHVRMPEAA